MENQLPEWEKEYKRLQHNAVFFIEEYWNKRYPEKRVELTRNEKQEVFDKYKSIPYVGDVIQLMSHLDKVKALKDKGYEDWDIY